MGLKFFFKAFLVILSEICSPDEGAHIPKKAFISVTYKIFSLNHISGHNLWINFQYRGFASVELQKQSPEVLYKKGVVKNFAKLTGKNQCQSLFFNKVEGLRPQTFAKFLRTRFLQNTSGLLLMQITQNLNLLNY